jgi:hypothetical protein
VSETEKKLVHSIERGGFRADIYETKPNHFEVQYFGPRGRDFGPRNHVANLWEAFSEEIEKNLAGLAQKYPD